MTSYVQGTGLAGAGNLDVIELRVILVKPSSLHAATNASALLILARSSFVKWLMIFLLSIPSSLCRKVSSAASPRPAPQRVTGSPT